ncbi:DUF5076 domain-containing protein [Rhodobacterales bacterium HKCCE2091]|nr:DUF5076 domain-containing protein [Rhodobacterales bacterium HKCCE2091]
MLFRKRHKLDDPLLVAFFDDEDALNVMIDDKQVEDGHFAGRVLADFAKHLSMMLHQTGKSESEASALASLRSAFDTELNNPTDRPTGHLRD